MALDSAGFWGQVTAAASPEMEVTAQVQALRPLWLHGQLVAVVLPYALDSEADWFFEMTRQAWARPAGYQRPKLELHVSSLREDNDADIKAQGDKHWRLRDFLVRVRSKLSKGMAFHLYVRAGHHGSQRFISRRLFAGEEKDVGTGIPEIRVRWGISLEHVASLNDAPNQTSPTFTLLRREQAKKQFDSECRNPGACLFGPFLVQI